MIETLYGINIAIELFMVSVLFFIAVKMAVLNDVSHEIRDIIVKMK